MESKRKRRHDNGADLQSALIPGCYDFTGLCMEVLKIIEFFFPLFYRVVIGLTI